MSTTTTIGRVACVGRGAYDATAEYAALDIISHEGSSYMVVAECCGEEPPNANYYMLLAEAGATGNTGAQGPQGEKGDKGDTGTGLQIKGTYADLAALQAAVTHPAAGDMYNVGSAAPYDVYMWNGTEWEDQGQLQGPTGPGVPVGGTAGQVLEKVDSTDFNGRWVDPPTGSVQTVNAVSPDANGDVTLTPASIGTAPALQSNVTYYVATTGNDTTGNGMQTNPFATVNKALSMIPKNLNGFAATISMGAGAYTESITVNSFMGGTIVFVATTDRITLNGNIYILACFCTVSIIGIATIKYNAIGMKQLLRTSGGCPNVTTGMANSIQGIIFDGDSVYGTTGIYHGAGFFSSNNAFLSNVFRKLTYGVIAQGYAYMSTLNIENTVGYGVYIAGGYLMGLDGSSYYVNEADPSHPILYSSGIYSRGTLINPTT